MRVGKCEAGDAAGPVHFRLHGFNGNGRAGGYERYSRPNPTFEILEQVAHDAGVFGAGLDHQLGVVETDPVCGRDATASLDASRIGSRQVPLRTNSPVAVWRARLVCPDLLRIWLMNDHLVPEVREPAREPRCRHLPAANDPDSLWCRVGSGLAGSGKTRTGPSRAGAIRAVAGSNRARPAGESGSFGGGPSPSEEQPAMMALDSSSCAGRSEAASADRRDSAESVRTSRCHAADQDRHSPGRRGRPAAREADRPLPAGQCRHDLGVCRS